MKKYYYIYKITFLKGKLKGKYYIGKKVGYKPDIINDGYFGSGIVCTRYYKKYPPVIGETITKEILDVCESKEQLAECEKKWIGDLWETDDLCVNMKSGGEGGWDFCKGKSMPAEQRRKISESNKGKIMPPVSLETRKRLSVALTGKHHSQETKQKISESNKGKHLHWTGKHHSQETKQKMSESQKNKIFSEEHRKHISESHKGKTTWIKGKKHTLEARKKMSIAKKGKSHKSPTQETKNKISVAQKGNKWINNGIQNKNVRPELLEQYLSEGWQIGMLRKKAA